MPDPKRKLLSRALPQAALILALVSLCAVSFYAGNQFAAAPQNGKYLVADKDAVILAAVFDRDSTDTQALQAEITQPILQLMRRYAEQGYVIIDGARDERGNYTIAALPPGTRDITPELSAAIRRKAVPK